MLFRSPPYIWADNKMKIFLKKGLHFRLVCAIINKLSDTKSFSSIDIRVWRSLVSRLNGVQEALSSNLSTRTTSEQTTYRLLRFFYKNQSKLILLLLLSKTTTADAGLWFGFFCNLVSASFSSTQSKGIIERWYLFLSRKSLTCPIVQWAFYIFFWEIPGTDCNFPPGMAYYIH